MMRPMILLPPRDLWVPKSRLRRQVSGESGLFGSKDARFTSGDTLAVYTAQMNEPPSSVNAILELRNGIWYLGYDDTTEWKAVFRGVLDRKYSGGGLTISLHWVAKTATTGNVIWGTEIERDNASNHDLDTDAFATQQLSSASAANGTCGKVTVATTTHGSGAAMDSLAIGEAFRLRVDRVAASGSDTMVGNAQLLAVEIKET